jgi:hypothetical protein
MSAREDIRGQIIGALSGAAFPMASPAALLAAFPDAAETKCKSGELEMTAGEAGKVTKIGDFPFKSAEEVADTILNRAGL